jgi:hypothetical protein
MVREGLMKNIGLEIGDVVKILKDDDVILGSDACGMKAIILDLDLRRDDVCIVLRIENGSSEWLFLTYYEIIKYFEKL